MDPRERALRIFDTWRASLPHRHGGEIPKGTISVALQVLQDLHSDFDLDLTHHMAPGKGQIKGLSYDKQQ
jgi:hypothetical protein